MVKITVGKEHKEYSVHKDLLCHYSSFFRGALNNSFKEGEEQAVTLDDERTDVFEAFIHFVYTGQLMDDETKIDYATLNGEETINHSSRTQRLMIKIWIFGDKRGAPRVQNQALNALHADICQSKLTWRSSVPLIYDNTNDGACLRAFWVERSIGDNVSDYREAFKDGEYSAEYLADICDRHADLSANGETAGDLSQVDLCRFHIHDSEDCQGRVIQK